MQKNLGEIMSSDLAQPNPHFLHHHGVYSLGLLGGADSPGGGLVGLQAKGFPSGAQHVPVTVPRSLEKLHCVPLLNLLQASMASGGGLGCGPTSFGGWDIATCAQPMIMSVVRIADLVNRIVGLLVYLCGSSEFAGDSVHHDCGGILSSSASLPHADWGF
jgi:hypothetical protein